MTKEKDQLSARQVIFTLITMLIFPVLLIFLSGDWVWIEGWLFSIWFVVLCFTTIIYLYRHDPSLLAERYRKPGTGKQKGWDRFVVYGLTVGFLLWIVIMPLDAKRLSWTAYFPLWLKVLGGFGLLLSFFFFFRSYVDNTFVSPLVRIQKERKQRVVSEGVYGFVRHPMYLAGIVLFIGTPMLLGSKYGLIIGLVLAFLLAGRIIGEEKMLINELEGYLDYKKKVKYRLIPFIW
jgi:protein-S-isoprenylcysteine O-methyltransferase Ste14